MSRNAYYSMDHIRAHRIYPPSPPNTATATSTPTSPQNFMPLKTDSSEKWYPSRQQPQIHSQRLLEDDAYFNIDKVVQQYGEQPELLELILSSKLEEDRRRAEEAKLRQKEIDYMLQQQQPLQPSRQKRPAEMLPRIKSFAAVDNGWRNTSPPPPPAAHIQQSHPQEQRRNSSLLLSQPIITTPNATSPSVHTPSTTSTTTNSTPTLPPILSPYEPSVPVHPPYPGPSPIFRRDSASSTSQSMPSLLDKLPIPPSNNRSASRPSTTRRRRRVMQAISTIIETREFPYNDDYLWKNNGNTIHKKTGHRSIYYKCSNSAKGCLVNKTVTFKENGEYLIKYRGEHLEECNRIKRIVDV